MIQNIKIPAITALFLLFGIITVNAQFIQKSSVSLFSDVKAFQEGDAITVLIIEDTQADNTATTYESQSADFGAGFDLSTGDSRTNIDFGLERSNGYKAKGQTTRREKIRSRLSAKVASVEENGILKIEGKRTTTINGETQEIIITGFVRTVDIMPNNSVYSYNILDLSLQIIGDGTVSDIQEPGIITKILRYLF